MEKRGFTLHKLKEGSTTNNNHKPILSTYHVPVQELYVVNILKLQNNTKYESGHYFNADFLAQKTEIQSQVAPEPQCEHT